MCGSWNCELHFSLLKRKWNFPLYYYTNVLHLFSGLQLDEGGKEEQTPAKRARQMSDDDDDDDKEDESSVSMDMLFWNWKVVSL